MMLHYYLWLMHLISFRDPVKIFQEWLMCASKMHQSCFQDAFSISLSLRPWRCIKAQRNKKTFLGFFLFELWSPYKGPCLIKICFRTYTIIVFIKQENKSNNWPWHKVITLKYRRLEFSKFGSEEGWKVLWTLPATS